MPDVRTTACTLWPDSSSNAASRALSISLAQGASSPQWQFLKLLCELFLRSQAVCSRVEVSAQRNGAPGRCVVQGGRAWPLRPGTLRAVRLSCSRPMAKGPPNPHPQQWNMQFVMSRPREDDRVDVQWNMQFAIIQCWIDKVLTIFFASVQLTLHVAPQALAQALAVETGRRYFFKLAGRAGRRASWHKSGRS